jgi:hypothetical protein
MPASVTPPPPAAPTEPKPAPAARKEPEPVKPAEPEEPKERKKGRGALIGFGIAAVVAAVLGFVIGGSGGGGNEEEGGGAPSVAASNADVATKFPSSWKKLGSVPEIPGYTFAAPIAQAPGGAQGGESVVVGQVKDANNSTLLPAGFLQALGLDAGEVPPRQAVRLVDNKLEAYRYANLRPRGVDQPVTLFTVPTSAGVATVACVDPSADCESIANTLKLNGGTAFPVGPSKEYASALGKTLGGLNKKVESGRKALQGADTPGQQANAAKDLSAAYKSASSQVSKLKTSPSDAAVNQDLASALKKTSDAYGKLASAASSNNKGAYTRASRTAQRSEQAVADQLRNLEQAGYKLAE